MKTLIWIDDIRDPFSNKWNDLINSTFKETPANIVWLKSYNEFVEYLNNFEFPTFISFDHDLGDTSDNEKSGYSCAKYLINFCIDKDINIPTFAIHSSNPAGEQNIRGLLNNYNNFYNKTHGIK